MRLLKNANPGSRGLLRRLWRAERGAVAVYVGITTAAMIGFGALVVDLGRLFTTNTELQAAADAIALAGATELDGTDDAIARATAAANDIVSNNQTFAAGGPEVGIAGIRFLTDLASPDPDPYDYDAYNPFVTAVSADARFIEVTVEARTVNYLLAGVLKTRIGGDGTGSDSGTTNAVAIAGINQVVCKFPPLMICNPAEAGGNKGAPFAFVDGQQLMLKGGGGTSWAPGNFGLLDDPTGAQGASKIVPALASSTPKGCFGTNVDTHPGNVTPVKTAINIRFDIYENPSPGIQGNPKNQEEYAPAPNVTKGKWKDGSNWVKYEGTPLEGMPLPLHPCLELDPQTCTSSGSNNDRFSPDPMDDPSHTSRLNEYWEMNHPPATTVPADADMNGDGLTTLEEIYRYEIGDEFGDNIPNNTGGDDGTASNSTGENGHPYESSWVGDYDRRVIPVAVVNCLEHEVQGNSEDVPVEAFAKMFLIRSVDSASDPAIYAEIVAVLEPGVDDVLHDIVQLYR